MTGRAITLPTALLSDTRDDGQEEALTSVLGRIFEERGHFRHVTEQTLEAEIAAEDDQDSSSDADDEDDETGDGDEADGKSRPEQLFATRAAMLDLIKSANNEILMALDFTSLAISKEMGKQADLTMSPVLKQLVKPGTLGLEMWSNVQPDKDIQNTDDVISRAWKMQSLQACADSLLGAAARLGDTVKRETRYWDQVLSVSERGWSLCRMPREKHNLGVRFGFLEAHGEYRERGLAALRTDELGNIILEKGLRNASKSIRVRTKRGGKTVGLSSISRAPVDSKTPLETRIRAARDSLYEEELFHEIIRESRTLASYGVEMHGSSIHMPTRLDAREALPAKSDFDEVLIDLISPDDESDDVDHSDSSQDQMAQAVAVTFRLLLSHTHRERLKHRSELPPPMSLTRRDPTVAHILRPVLAVLHHYSLSRDIDSFFVRLGALLAKASITASVEPSTWEGGHLHQSSSLDSLMAVISAPLHSQSTISIEVPGRREALRFILQVHTDSSAAALGSRILVQSSLGTPEIDCSGIEDLVDSFDAIVANAITFGIAESHTDWTYSERLAYVSRPRGGGKVSVELHSGTTEGRGGYLMLNTGDSRAEWSSEGKDGDQRQFWDVVGKMN